MNRYALEGTLRYSVDDTVRALRPGDWMFTPRGSFHGFSSRCLNNRVQWSARGVRVADPMKTTRGLPVALRASVLVFLLVAPVEAALGQDDLPAAEAAAMANVETTDGKQFAEALEKGFGREHGRTIQQCAKGSKRADLSDFDLFLRVDGTGVVDQALVMPTTTLATCVAGKLRGWKTSVPPHAGFWVQVEVILKSK